MPPARDWRLSKGRPEVILRATQGNCNNIPYRKELYIARTEYLKLSK